MIYYLLLLMIVIWASVVIYMKPDIEYLSDISTTIKNCNILIINKFKNV